MTAEEIRAARRQSPPKEVRLLIPVWGNQYLIQFLHYLLPTLLAPGNIPGIAAKVPVRFIALCDTDDFDQINTHPTWKRLTAVCKAETKPINDIMMSSNSASTTVTLAFEREVRAAGSAITDTCFIFLTPDYIMANGSLLGLWNRMLDGASGIQAGNFQVAADTVRFDQFKNARLTWMRPPNKRLAALLPEPSESYLDRTAVEGLDRRPSASLSPMDMETLSMRLAGVVSIAEIPARQLATFAMANLHPVTIGNTVNFLATHNAHTNRLFWWVDEKTMIGRFFLMHMVCIRPERGDFQIGSSCDYSFIPEMCPSGNVDIITDSDEYFVIEAQSRQHENKFIRYGSMRPERLAKSLAEWTTALHRANADHTIVFHGGALPERFAEVRAEADAFVATVKSLLTSPPLPHRGHPYWRQAAAYNHFFSGKQFTDEDYAALLASTTGPTTPLEEFGARFERWVSGGRPLLGPWQPRWMDFRGMREHLREPLQGNDKRILLITGEPIRYLEWARSLKRHELVVSFPWHFAKKVGRASPRWPTKFDVVIAELSEDDIRAKVSIDRIGAVVKPGGHLIALVLNQRQRQLGGFNPVVTGNLDLLQATSAGHVFARFVRMSRLRWRTAWALERLARSCQRHPKSSPLVAALAVALMPVLLLVNGLELLTTPLRWARQRWSSVFLVFRIPGAGGD